MEQSDYRRGNKPNVFFGARNAISESKFGVFIFNTMVLIVSTLVLLGLLHWILRRQLEVRRTLISRVARASRRRYLQVWQFRANVEESLERRTSNEQDQNENQTRLIVAASEHDPDMLYATKFWAPDPFIFLERNGKRTLVLSDLEIDRGRKQAKADEFVMFSELEREVQGKSKKAPPYEKVLAHFLRKRGVRSAAVPANFPLGYAEELAANKIRVRATERIFLAGARSQIGQGN